MVFGRIERKVNTNFGRNSEFLSATQFDKYTYHWAL